MQVYFANADRFRVPNGSVSISISNTTFLFEHSGRHLRRHVRVSRALGRRNFYAPVSSSPVTTFSDPCRELPKNLGRFLAFSRAIRTWLMAWCIDISWLEHQKVISQFTLSRITMLLQIIFYVVQGVSTKWGRLKSPLFAIVRNKLERNLTISRDTYNSGKNFLSQGYFFYSFK